MALPPAAAAAPPHQAEEGMQPFTVTLRCLHSHSPVLYCVRVHCHLTAIAWEVLHQYSDFAALHHTLLEQELIPPLPLPPKRIARDGASLAQRAADLEAYCAELLKFPLLLCHSAVNQFFDLDGGLWKTRPHYEDLLERECTASMASSALDSAVYVCSLAGDEPSAAATPSISEPGLLAIFSKSVARCSHAVLASHSRCLAWTDAGQCNPCRTATAPPITKEASMNVLPHRLCCF
uniref:PX domain-containing protein n=1 Tax=Coccolithus braarudii TaxID=221442 RepID=A0A7S0Q658_9EUKA|mmetsp:Transcript_38813/g.82689  ORF Transcript_38813/g.82689 Transcript_38813/m.82689 type:complete len:235 (+) Transcript_38813:171-875(+)